MEHPRPQSDAASLKDAGNKAFAAKQYTQAIDLFTQAIQLDENNHVLWSNRSAAKAGLKDWSGALEDADQVSFECELHSKDKSIAQPLSLPMIYPLSLFLRWLDV